MELSSVPNPTVDIDLNFKHYLERRHKEVDDHLVGGIPDYGFSLDHKLRQQMARMGVVRQAADLLLSTQVQHYRDQHQKYSIAVGPSQFNEIYSIGVTCAQRLGIGIPQIFISPTSELNAYTIATDDAAPVIIISSQLVDALGLEELRFVVGHECGHIHNLHGVYNTILVIMTYPLQVGMMKTLVNAGKEATAIKLAGAIFQGSVQFFLSNWSRYAEVTCDRAGLICSGDLQAAQNALVCLATGGARSLRDLNVDKFIEQLNISKSNTFGVNELFSTHPLIIKRIKALRLFAECDLYYNWHPELSPPSDIRNITETDALCEQVIGVIKKLPWQRR